MSDQPPPSPPLRRVRSFVRRAGRITPAQARALDEQWARYGLDAAARPLDLDAVFGRRAPRVLEIGFGNGDTLLALAAAQPGHDFVGIEVHEPGVGHFLMRAAQAGLGNVRVSREDAVEVLQQQIADGALAEALIFFPDPWPKARHHKRRLLQPPFAALLARTLEHGGLLRVATDWQNYAEQILAVLNDCPELRNCAPDGGYAPRPQNRPATRFERRGQRLGHGVWDFAYRRV